MLWVVAIVSSILVGTVIGVIVDESTIGKHRDEAITNVVDTNKKFQEFYKITISWLELYQKGRSIAGYLNNKGYKKIAIYGMKDLGVVLLNELKKSEVQVLYTIDRDAENIYAAADVYKPDEELTPVDAIVVTAVHYFTDIKNDLEKKMNCPIISLEDVIDNAR